MKDEDGDGVRKLVKSRVNEAGNYTKPGMRKGKQFVSQPKDIAKKTARHR